MGASPPPQRTPPPTVWLNAISRHVLLQRNCVTATLFFFFTFNLSLRKMKTASEPRDNESKPMSSWEATAAAAADDGGKPAMKQIIRWIQCPVISVQLAKWQRKVIFLLQGFLFFDPTPLFQY